jgi:hypothetical protein
LLSPLLSAAVAWLQQSWQQSQLNVLILDRLSEDSA